MAGEPAPPSPQLILAFDFGTRRIGLAAGDTLTRTARGLSTLDCGRERACGGGQSFQRNEVPQAPVGIALRYGARRAGVMSHGRAL